MAVAGSRAGEGRRGLEHERWPLWLPVALGGGDALYFALAREPQPWAAWLAGGAGGGYRWPRSLGWRRIGCALLAALALGFALAKWREIRVAAPVLNRPLIAHLSARIDAIEPRESGLRLLLSDPRSGAFGEAPRRLRLALRGDAPLHAGGWISVTSSLQPPPAPVEPGANDFGRSAFFQSVGAVGFAYGGARPVIAPRPPVWTERIADRVENLRWRMTNRIQAALPGSTGAIAAALITGTRGGIADEDEAALRDAGLAHVLAIAGLHMALVGGGLFWLVRAVLAAIPRLSLAYPIKKWAAGAALAGAGFYLVISGAAPSTVRAFVMLAMLLTAILFDRPALSMRSVALAAAILLIFRPEAILEPGFQMSFAAVVALIAVAEWEQARAGVKRNAAMRYVRGIALTSLIGSLATLPFALFHFDRVTHYAVLGNLLAMPVMGFWVMPAAALSVLAMPFGLEHWPLHLLGSGIAAMLAVGRFVSALPGAVSLAPAMPLPALVAVSLGGLWLAIWRRQKRWWGLAPMLLGALLALWAPRPDMLVAADAQTIALRGDDGLLHFMRQPKDRFAAEQWLRRDGDARAPQDAVGLPGLHCDGVGCAIQERVMIAAATRPEALAEDCTRAAIVISAIPAKAAPDRKSLIDRDRALRDGGGYAITLIAGDSSGAERPAMARDAAVGGSITPDQADQFALHLDPVGAVKTGLVGRVRRFQGDGITAPPEPLQGRLAVIDQRDDDFAGAGGIDFLNDDGIAVENAGIDHGVARHFQGVMFAAADHAAGHRHFRNLVLQRFDGRAGGDAADQRHIHNAFAVAKVAPGCAAAPCVRRHARFAAPMAARQAALRLASGGGGPQGFRHVVRQFEHFQGAGALFHPAQEAALFQGGDQAVDAGLGFEVQRFLHFIEGGGDAGFPDSLMDEHQKLILFPGQHVLSFPSAVLRVRPTHRNKAETSRIVLL